MEDIARVLNISATLVRERNLIVKGDETHYGQLLEECTLGKCWSECKHQSGYDQSLQEIERCVFVKETLYHKNEKFYHCCTAIKLFKFLPFGHI